MLFALVVPNAWASVDGSLDTTFDTDGKVTTPIGTAYESAEALILQPDGKLVAAGPSLIGSNSRDFALVRYNPDGSLDTGFDTDGKVTTQIGEGNDFANDLILQPDGKLVVAGLSFNGNDDDFALVRYNTDGSLDTAFDTDGKVTTVFNASTADSALALILQPDGKLVAAGFTDNGTTREFALVRYNTDGSLDTAFDTDGKVTTPIGTYDSAAALILQPDGKLVAAGLSYGGISEGFTLVRYNTDGSLDTTFDTDGKVTTPIGPNYDEAEALILQPDGKLVAAGLSHDGNDEDFALVRYNTDGSLDTTFDTDGKVTIPVGLSTDDAATDLVLQPDGKLVAAGRVDPDTVDFALIRLNPDGSLDTTFDGDGQVTTAIGSSFDEARALVRQPNGRLVAAGHSWNGTDLDFALVRYHAWDTPAADFDGDGDTDIGVFRPSVGGWYIQDQSTVFHGLPGDIAVPGDYDGDGLADRAIFRPDVGGWYIEGQATVFYGLPGDIPVPADYDNDGDTDPAVYRPAVGGWYIHDQPTVFHGLNTDVPVPGDYDSNGTTDIAIFRPEVGGWYIRNQTTMFHGLPSDIPVPGDYDGDGDTDPAVYRDGAWLIRDQATVYLGLGSDIPLPGDYDGDGVTDPAVYRDGAWYIDGQTTTYHGLSGDIPTPKRPTATA